MFAAKIIADSVNKTTGKRIVTMQLCYPRFIHSEIMTHRVFSRNAMSSRAVPTEKMMKQVWDAPAMPIHWGKNEPGMSASKEFEGKDKDNLIHLWRSAAEQAVHIAMRMDGIGVHKQVVNRLLEPFQWMHTIVTSTEWDNFYALRCHKDAQPEIQHLAMMMEEEMKRSTPIPMTRSHWHLPYVSEAERAALPFDVLIKCSVARCARVSYLNHDGSSPEIHKDVKLYERLVGSEPKHASPAEHQAMAMDNTERSNNFTGGWKQFRDILDNTPTPAG